MAELKTSTQDVQNELETLLANVQCAHAILLNPPKTASRLSFKSQVSKRSTKSAKSSKPGRTKLKSSPTKAFFSRVAQPFRMIGSRRHKKKYDQLEETTSLISDRRGSADSDATLVAIVQEVDETGHLLEILAPLVSALQRLTLKIDDGMEDLEGVQAVHQELCEKMLSLVEEVKDTVTDNDGGKDEYDVEMACLMLDALTKKIQKERLRVRTLSAETQSEETLVTHLAEVKDIATHDSPLLPIGRNPFIVHSTSIALAPRQTSVTKSQPIGDASPGPAAGTYSGFASSAQQTWARNVIRLGSYQSSMLFSPSPVAVRPLVGISQIK